MKREVFWKNPGYKGFPKLDKNIECDYLIVGGGITGVSLAYFLAKDTNKKIVLIEKNQIASGATGKAAGSIVISGELDLKQMTDIFGMQKGLRFWKENHKGLALMKKIVEKENIKCDFDCEDTFYATTFKTDKEDQLYVIDEYALEKDFDKLTELLVGKNLKKNIDTNMFRYAVLSKKSGISVNPLAFTQNLSKVASRNGVKIYEDTPFIKFIDEHSAMVGKNKITFDKAIISIDSSTRDDRIKKIASTIVVTERINKRNLVKSKLIPKKIIWDAADIYYYMKITKDNRILLGYGDKHVHKKHTKINPHEPHFKRIKKFLTKLFPRLNTRIEYAWTGSFGTTQNRIPLIEHKGNKIIVAGAASQLVCLMSSRHIANRLENKKSKLSEFFGM